MSIEKVCLTEANLPPVSSKNLMSKLINHIVFFDENLQEIEILLQGKEEIFRYIPVGKLDDLLETISSHLSGTESIDISLLAHGSREGIRIGRNFFNEKYISNKSLLLKGLNVNKLSIFACNTGQNINLLYKFSQLLNCDVFVIINFMSMIVF